MAAIPLPILTSTAPDTPARRDKVGVSIFECHTALQRIGYWVPERRSSPDEVEKRVNVRINVSHKTGVRQYRQVDEDTSPVDMALRAIEHLFSKPAYNGKTLSLADVDVLIYCGVTRACLEPATATLIQERLGLDCIVAFDVSNACLGFLDGFCLANALISSGQAESVLLVTAEIGTLYNRLAAEALARGDKPDSHFASLTLGDGAVAALVTATDPTPGSLNFRYGIRRTLARYSDLCIIRDKHSPMQTQPAKLFSAALLHFTPLIRDVVAATGWSMKDIDLIVPHQASSRAITLGALRVGYPLRKTAVTVKEFGNMASAALPFALAHAIEKRGLEDLHRIALLGFGSGLGIAVFTLEQAR